MVEERYNRCARPRSETVPKVGNERPGRLVDAAVPSALALRVNATAGVRVSHTHVLVTRVIWGQNLVGHHLYINIEVSLRVPLHWVPQDA